MPRSILKLSPGIFGNLHFQATPHASEKRIVHIGLGAFARAHIAVLTQIANVEAAQNWRISGVVRNNQSLKEALGQQGHRYTVYEIAEPSLGRVIDCVDEVLVWKQDYAAIISRLSESTTQLVTITVTEKGYHLNHQGTLNLDDDEINLDLKHCSPETPESISSSNPALTLPGLLCQAARVRMQEGMPGLSLLSCDNLSSNGKLLKAALVEFASKANAQLGEWIEQNFNCPDTVVDCIVPKVTPEQVRLVQSKLNVDDDVPVLCEPFRQWVIGEKNLFAHSLAPPWELSGAEFVSDTRLYEEQKLRILNAAHSALAYLGLLQGCRWVSEAIAKQEIRDQLNLLMEEVLRCFADQASALNYYRSVVTRFENQAMRHELTQIGTDGSNKIPLRWGPSISAIQHDGRDTSAFAVAIAAWLACWKMLPTEKIDDMSDPKQSAILLLAEQLAQSRSDTKLWHELLGVEPGEGLQQEIQAAFLKFSNSNESAINS